MDSFEAKIGWRRIRKRENKSSRSIPFRSCQTRNKKFQKKFKKLKNTIVASFQAKIRWKMLRKRENKNYPSILFLPVA